MNNTIQTIIEHLQPSFAEYADDSKFMHWMEYAVELDELSFCLSVNGAESLVDRLNSQMKSKTSNTPEHEACVDVASTVQSLLPNKFKGRFKYA